MKIIRVFAILAGVLLLIGCGDQMWCGDDGCRGQVDGNMTDGRYGKNTEDNK